MFHILYRTRQAMCFTTGYVFYTSILFLGHIRPYISLFHVFTRTYKALHFMLYTLSNISGHVFYILHTFSNIPGHVFYMLHTFSKAYQTMYFHTSSRTDQAMYFISSIPFTGHIRPCILIVTHLFQDVLVHIM